MPPSTFQAALGLETRRHRRPRDHAGLRRPAPLGRGRLGQRPARAREHPPQWLQPQQARSSSTPVTAATRRALGHRSLEEARLALDLARRIEGRLSAHGVSVVFTHTETTDGGTDEDRAAFANSCDADLVLSLHTDHSQTGAAHGAATYLQCRRPCRVVGHR